MSQIDGNTKKSVCDLNENIKTQTSEKIESLKNNLKKTLEKIDQTVQSGTQSVKDKANQTSNKVSDLKSDIIQRYYQTPIGSWRNARPDITLLLEITVIIVLLLTVYAIGPYLSGETMKNFTREQYLRASELPQTAFSIGEIGKVNTELRALDDYMARYKSDPFSPENQGIYDLQRGTIFLPIIEFIVIYVVPPFVVLYLIWFILTYWKYVISALWGWFLMIYSYSTKLIECKLASKWYIRMVTGWRRCNPRFSDYFNKWRRKYVDVPVYHEKLRYIREYYAAKQRYYTIPKRYYVDIPRERYKIKTEYLRKVYVERTTNVFLKKLLDWYQIYYELPRDELYGYLLRNNANLAALWAKLIQSKKQVFGLPYEKTTPSGGKCSCPATRTPVKLVSNFVEEEVNLIKDDVKTAVNKVQNLYDNIGQIRSKYEISSCQVADQVIENRNNIYLTILLSMVIFIVIVYIYSEIFGTPHWVYSIISPTWTFVTTNSNAVLTQGNWDYRVILVIVVLMGSLGYGLYQIKDK